ncbi:ferredoxin [Hyalangium rubrum]|uniref:Ferredoxin n=1 Tax=Hyalangium rubrum TaxID=3103134 RepID=A0ABU5HD48_9BACT|nr:ferredoxin [Hyalangium sp. s54d21]MDY7231195.1 ferredoxin [Hyalangium sp. s54d21]
MSAGTSLPRRWRVRVTESCAGCGLCVIAADRYFHLVDDYSQAQHTEVDPDEAVIAAAELCPMNAIEVVDAETGAEVVPTH